MKKIFTTLVTLGLLSLLIGCTPSTNSNGSTTTVKTTVFNPNETTVKLVTESSNRAASSVRVVCEVPPKEKQEVELEKDISYYFTDENDNKIADLAQSDRGDYLPVYLELNEPKDGKEYLMLNQYKNADFLEKDPGANIDIYGLLLYEVVDPNDLDAYRYDENTYIRIYPSANYWIDSEAYASNKIGTKITFDEDFRKNFTELSDSWVAWGWGTRNEQYDIWFCHRVVSFVLHAKDGDKYTKKELVPKTLDLQWWNPADNGWNSAWYFTSYTVLEDDINNDKTKFNEYKVIEKLDSCNPVYCLLKDYSDDSWYLATASKNENNQISINWKKVTVTIRQN